MTKSMLPSPDLMRIFGLSSPVFVEETNIAYVWKATRTDKTFAALKLYKAETMGNEGAGIAFLKALDGVGAARVYADRANAVVTEWLGGPSLGDLTRRGDDERATTELVAIANVIHGQGKGAMRALQPLNGWFDALFRLKFGARLPADARQNLQRAQVLARRLLADQSDICALHGDLHQDNIRLGARGYCSFDAKGLVGDRAYEVANAFRSPKGAEQLIRDPACIRRRAAIWGAGLGVAHLRLLEWAAAKTALSISWRSGPTLEFDPEFDLLDVQLGVLGDY